MILKKKEALEPGHFQPISFVHSTKMVAEIMVNRMKPLLPKWISPEWGEFVGERSIFDNILVAQECMHDL